MLDLSEKELHIVVGSSCRCVCQTFSETTMMTSINMGNTQKGGKLLSKKEIGYVLTKNECSRKCEENGDNWIMQACYTRGCTIL